MTTAQYVATIDRLRALAFPARRGRPDTGTGGSGYHLVVLGGGEVFPVHGDAGAPEAEGDQLGAEHEALVSVLDARWGEAQMFSLWSMLTRRMSGEEIPDPWGELCAIVPSLSLWRAEGRWIAVGVQGEQGEGPGLIVVVTDVDPP
ncbi:hypothetical protein [Streptomyces sp. NBC_00859]|uniref:hypothetical protein n=1 Tax=Streptomyces sp. NBC_00859 TaxID=2903682 RepID=UPI0038635EA7|nr:hypothetical protein OG584_31205 [Streptomyces sp. NBC_00859]